MAYELRVRPRARRNKHDQLSLRDFRRIDAAISALADNPRPPGAVKLRGQIYRIRVGPWRIIYAILDEEQLVIVGKIARRAEDTYDRVGDLF